MTSLPQDFSKTRFRFLVVSEMCLFQRAVKWLSNLLHEPFVRANIKQNLLQTEQVDSRLTSLASQTSLALTQSTCDKSTLPVVSQDLSQGL